jgi:hypothetical protein
MSGEKMTEGKKMAAETKVTEETKLFEEKKTVDPFIAAVGSTLRRRRSSKKKRFSTEAVCIGWPKIPLHKASALQTDLKIE